MQAGKSLVVNPEGKPRILYKQTSTEKGFLLDLPGHALSLSSASSPISPFCLVKNICECGSHNKLIPCQLVLPLALPQLARQATTAFKGQVKDSDFHSLHRTRLQSWRLFGIKQT